MNGFLEAPRLKTVQNANPSCGTEIRKLKRHDFYVYAYLDPRKPGTFVYQDYSFDHEPFYVGKGTGNRCYFLENHQHGLCGNKIKKLKSLNLKSIIRIIKNEMFEKAAHALECDLIDLIGRQDLGTGTLCNHTDGGEGTSGHIKSIETRLKLSAAAKGRIVSEETRRKKSKSLKGKNTWSKGFKHSEESKRNMVKGRIGFKFSEESKKRMSDAAKGKIVSEITRKKLSDYNKGKKHSEESKRKRSESLKGIKTGPRSEETRRRIGESGKGRVPWNKGIKGKPSWNKGLKFSEESKRNMSEAHKKFHQNKLAQDMGAVM
jgi:hypothetical protein